MRIGITCRDESRVWNNGLHQNSYNLFILYKKLGLDVSLVSQNVDSKKIFNDEIKQLTIDSIDKYDIILEVSESVSENIYQKIIDKNKKIVSINYGNVLMILNEDVIINKKTTVSLSRENVENWLSPHFYFSKGLTKVISKKEPKFCPYIWSPDFLVKSSERSGINIFESVKKLDVRKIGILEPNINFIKTCIYPILGCENLERRDSDKISEILVFNSDRLKKSVRFLEIIKNFDIYKNKKISFEERYSLPFLINKGYFGTIISNHIYNDLNYLTLESLFLNLPIIHNSNFCKEAGFYYENQNSASDISNLLEKIIDSYHLDDKEYRENSQKVLWKFSPDNPDNIKKYEELLNSII